MAFVTPSAPLADTVKTNLARVKATLLIGRRTGRALARPSDDRRACHAHHRSRHRSGDAGR